MANWKDKLRQVKETAGFLKEAAVEQARPLLDQHWQEIQQLWLQKVDPSIRATVMDDEKMSGYLRIIHEALPLPLRLAIKEETFIRVCLKHRDRWLPVEEEAAAQDQARLSAPGPDELPAALSAPSDDTGKPK